jgi:hypothetical protein
VFAGAASTQQTHCSLALIIGAASAAYRGIRRYDALRYDAIAIMLEEGVTDASRSRLRAGWSGGTEN